MGQPFERTRGELDQVEKDSLDRVLKTNPYRFRIRAEEHFPTLPFQNFLRELPNTSFKQVCLNHSLRGELLQGPTPTYLHRFVDASKWGRRLMKAEGGMLDADPIEYLKLFSEKPESQRRRILSSVTLGQPRGPVFATFSTSAENDPIKELVGAQMIRDVLGLRIDSGRLVCLKYYRDAVAGGKGLRFPTCADAGEHPFFHPAAPNAPYGYTWNIRVKRQLPLEPGKNAGGDESLPELVHENRTAEVIRNALPILVVGEVGPLPNDLPQVVPECEVAWK